MDLRISTLSALRIYKILEIDGAINVQSSSLDVGENDGGDNTPSLTNPSRSSCHSSISNDSKFKK